MKRLPGNKQVRDEIKFAHPILERFGVDFADLLRRAQEGTRDGYPTSSGLGEGSGGQGAYSDPVGDLATQDPMADPVRAAVFRVFSAWREIVNNIEIMGMAMARCEPVDPDNPTPIHADFIRGACANCKRVIYVGEKFRASRCDACYAYRRRHGGTEERPVPTEEETEVA